VVLAVFVTTVNPYLEGRFMADRGSDVIGAVLNFAPLDPIKALLSSAVINGVAAVPIMV